MNNIYKVIWSKAKNCYVVASEIARSHTKSATGSGKIGGVTRRSLLASLMALSLLCGGLGVAEAAVVHVNEGTGVTYAVYTTDQTYSSEMVDEKLNSKANATDVVKNTKDIATNKDNITRLENNKADKTYVDTEVGKKADRATTLTGYGITDAYTKDDVNNALNNKADKTYVDNAVANVDTKLASYATTAYVDGKITAEANARETAITTAIGQERNDRDTAIATAINGEAIERNQKIHDAITQEVTNRDAAITTAKTELEGKITAEEKARKEADDALKARDNELEGKITTLEGSGVKYDTAVKDTITLKGADRTKITNLKDADLSDSSTDAVTGKQLYKTNESLAAEKAERESKDNELDGKITTLDGKVTTGINELKAKDTELANKIQTNVANIQTNAANIAATDKRTAGIDRIDATSETTIEKNVTVDNKGNVTAKGKLKGEVVDAGAVNAGSLSVENASTLKGDVTMDKTLKVTGDTSLGKTDVGGALNVTGASDLKGDVTLGTPNGTNTVTVNGESHFKAAVNMDKGLNVTNGETNLKDTNVEGNLKVTGTITTDQMIFGDKPTNYTEIDKGHITSKNAAIAGDATQQSSSMEFDRTKLEVGVADKDSNGHLTMTADKTTIKNSDLVEKNYSEIVADKDSVTTTVKDEKDNTTSTKSTATEIRNYAKDAAGNKTINLQTATQNKSWAKDKDGNESSIVQTGKDITNTAEKGTITSKAKDIVNDASGNISNKSQTMDTTVTGKATESYGSLDTTVNGNETHIVKGTKTETVDGKVTENYKAGQATNVTGNQDIHVTGKQTNTVEGGQENIISGGQTNTITGGQINNITGDQTTTITGNKTETVTENVTEDYKKDLTTTVGGNETHEVKGTKTETVEGKVTENFKNGQETNVTGDQVIKVSGTQTTTATDINRNASSGMIDTIDNDYGTNTETKVAGKTTTDVSIKGTGEEGKYIRGANESRDYLIKGTLKNSETKTVEATSTEITDGNGKTSATIQNVTDLAGSVTNGTETGISGIHAKDDGSVSIDSIVTGGGTSSVINQKKGSITSAVGDRTNSTVISQDKDNVVIASSKGMVGIVGKDIVNNAQDTITNTAGTKITDKAGDSTVTTENGKGTTFAKTGSTAFSTKAGAPTDTNIAGNHITTGRVDANELGVSDKDGDNTADLSVKAGEGVKASAGNGITKGSLDVTADEVKTEVKDSEENHTNTSQTAKGINGYATDKDGNKTYTKVTATENSFQVQDKDGKIKNHQVNTKDMSENTITNGDKTNTVTSTADGTIFRNSKAAAPVTGASGAGDEVNTTIKGNTITTGKVTMDYAKVMKDLGVTGNAKVGKNLEVTGKTTTGSLEVTGTSTLNGEVIMGSNATVGNNLTVNGTTKTRTLNVTEDAEVGRHLIVRGNATIAGDVSANSYSVEGKTYINKDGINANNQKITNVADGSISEGSKDAVNGGQLYGMKTDLEHKVDKVGANAAAMANLHPMEFDPDSKWNIAAAMGNYGSETATAIGAFYRPNEDVMVNFSTAFGTGENMVGGGVSVRLGKGSNKLSREESNALKDQVDDLTARMDALLSVLNPNMSKDFPDVPENHWAYEAVSRLAGNDIVQGYPDGEFHGDRTMTRYEMAEIIYNALSRGAEAERELVEEFKPELQAMAASEKATAERAEG